MMVSVCYETIRDRLNQIKEAPVEQRIYVSINARL